MVKLPDPISGVAQPEPMYSRQPVVQAREAMAPVGQADENFASALNQAGQAIGKYTDEQANQQKALDLVRADATHQKQLSDLSRSFDSDTDYATQAQRFQSQADAQLKANSASIQDPQARALWEAKAAAANQTHALQIGRGADTMVKQGKVVDLTNSLDQYRDTLLDPNVTDAQRSAALQGINDGIAISQHSGIVDPRTADALRTKYLYGAPKEAAANMVDRDAPGFKQSYYQAAPAQNAQALETPGTEAKPIGGRLLPPAQAPAGNPVAGSVVDELRTGGASDNAIRGILANIKDESNFDPALRHPDQPNWTGEAHFAHGLYQEGGAEWNNYAAWLKENHADANWQDPKLQTQFLVQNLKENYPGVWQKMNAGTPEQAAQAFVSGYLKPAAGPMQERTQRYGQGVPEIDALTGGGASGKLNLPSWANSLSPLDKQQLIDRMHANLATQSKEQVAQLNTRVLDDIERLRTTGQVATGADGRTSLDQAKELFGERGATQYEKLAHQWNVAQLEHGVMHDLPDMPEADAEARLGELNKLAQNPNADYRAIQQIAGKASKRLDELKTMRARDPANAAAETSYVQAAQDKLQNIPVQNQDGSLRRPTHLEITGALAQAQLDAQAKLGIDPQDRRIVTRADAASLLNLGGKKPKDMPMPEFMDKMEAAAQRAKQAYGPDYAERALKEAIGFMTMDQAHSAIANGKAAKLAMGGELNNDDMLALQHARALHPMTTAVDAVTPSRWPQAPGYNWPQVHPSKEHLRLLQENPDQWPAFDAKFGAGAAARALHAAPPNNAAQPAAPSVFQRLFGPPAVPPEEQAAASALFRGANQVPAAMSQ